jgi:hypothetical protein
MAGQGPPVLDHRRLEDLLNQADADAGTLMKRPTRSFSRPAQTHRDKEKILLPAAQQANVASRFPRCKASPDHGALAAPVPTPTPAIIATIRAVLKAYNPLRKGWRSLTICEQLLGAQAPFLELQWLRRLWHLIMMVHSSWRPRAAP